GLGSGAELKRWRARAGGVRRGAAEVTARAAAGTGGDRLGTAQGRGDAAPVACGVPRAVPRWLRLHTVLRSLWALEAAPGRGDAPRAPRRRETLQRLLRQE